MNESPADISETADIAESTEEPVELPVMPSLAAMYATAARKAATSATLGRLRRIGPGGGPLPRSQGSRDQVLPSQGLPGPSLMVRGLTAEVSALTSYQHLFGDTVTEALPPGFVHVQAFPLQLAIMNRDGFPFSPAGLVHLENRVEQTEPLAIGRPIDIRATATNLRTHPKGSAFDVVTEVAPSGPRAEAGAEAGAEAPVWRSVSTYLAREAAPSTAVELAPAHAIGASEGPEEGPPRYPTGVWRLGADTGRRYASVSGDINPIHLSRASARLFGYHHPIAHGMYTAARALASLPGRRDVPLQWDVAFGSPVYLPSTVAMAVVSVSAEKTRTDPVRGVVWSPRSGRVHLRFTLTSG